jgi:urea transport system ATP-binding protein
MLTVYENLELALATHKGVWHTLFAKLDCANKDRIEQVLGTIGLTELRHQMAGILSHGQKQWLEIGMLLMQEPKVMLVDEPVAGMTHQEVERTAELLLSSWWSMIWNSSVPSRNIKSQFYMKVRC